MPRRPMRLHTHTQTHMITLILFFFLTKKSLSGTAGLPFSVEMMGAGLWCVDLTCTLDTGGVVGGGIDEHRPPPIVHPTWSRDWLVVWAEVDCWLWEALHPHFRGWGGCGWMCVSEQSVNVCVCVYKKKKKQKKLLYKDFMADFICVHFCPRKCRKAVKCINRVWMTPDFKILTKKKRRAWELNIRALLCYHFPKLLIKAWRQD